MLCTKFGSREDDFWSLSIYFSYYLPLEKGLTPHFNKHDFTSPKDALCQVWLKLALWFLRRRFLKLVNVFSLFPYYLPLEMGEVLQECFVLSLVKIGSVVLKKKILKFVNVISLLPYYFPFEKGVALYLNKLESPSQKDALCQVWLKLAVWFLRRRWKCEKFTDRRTDGQHNLIGSQPTLLLPPCRKTWHYHHLYNWSFGSRTSNQDFAYEKNNGALHFQS